MQKGAKYYNSQTEASCDLHKTSQKNVRILKDPSLVRLGNKFLSKLCTGFITSSLIFEAEVLKFFVAHRSI